MGVREVLDENIGRSDVKSRMTLFAFPTPPGLYAHRTKRVIGGNVGGENTTKWWLGMATGGED